MVLAIIRRESLLASTVVFLLLCCPKSCAKSVIKPEALVAAGFSLSQKLQAILDARYSGLLAPKHMFPTHRQSQPGEQRWLSLGQRSQSLLKRLFEKASMGRPIVVSAVGGSITAGAGKHWKLSYPFQFHRLLQQAFPQVSVKIELGARGDTCSTLAGFCLERLVGSNVDILFVEYAMNENVIFLDKKTGMKKVQDPGVPYENLVGRALSLYPTAVVICVGFWGLGFRAMPYMYSEHEAIAKHYDLGWLAADPLATWIMDHGLSNSSDIRQDWIGHPTDSFHNLLAQVTFISMMKHCRQHSRHWVSMMGAPPAMHAALKFENSSTPAKCDFTGKPNKGAEGISLQRNATGPLAGWHEISVMGYGRARRDTIEYLVPMRDLEVAVTFIRRKRMRDLQVAAAAEQGRDLLISTKIVDRLVVSLCQDGNFKNRFKGCPAGAPVKVLHDMSGDEVLLRPWLDDAAYGVWESTEPLPAGNYTFRIEPLAPCDPFTCIQGFVGL